MQRILQPGEIEALDHISFPRILLPQPAGLFADRAARLAQLAEGNPIGDYLRFAARLVKAQQRAAATVQTAAPDADAIARAQEHAMPLLPAADHLDAAWHGVLDQLLADIATAPELPAPLSAVVATLRAASAAERDRLARHALAETLPAADLAAGPFVMAAVQVLLADRASRLKVADVPYTDPATVCPVCGSAPVASVLRIGGAAGGHRYLHCSACATEWNMVRVKCSHCESTESVRYQGVDGAAGTKEGAVLAETCGTCHTYRKLVNQEKDPLGEPLADDLATLLLDLLMGDTEFARASGNPLLALAGNDA